MLVMDGKEALLKSDEEDEMIFDHTSLLNKEISFRDLSKKLYANGCKLQIARTINLCFSFFGLGLCFAIPTATLEDLKKSTGAGLDIRHIYTARYSGYLFGSLLGGFLFDRYNRQFLLFLSLLATSIGVIVMPFCSNVGSLMACTAITGITMGFLDTGGNVWCLDLWGRKSAPIMQTLHFCFGLGAFVAPLVAEPFLSPLYLNSSVAIEGNSTAGNATHRISHINFLHNGAPIKNLVPRGIENPNFSFPILADYEISKFRHFVFKRNATDNSSEAFGNSSAAQQNPSAESPADDLLNITSGTTATPARTFKPKPQYADGNQLKVADKWDRPSEKLQSILPNSTTTTSTSTVPVTTQKHPLLISNGKNVSEQSNSSNELTGMQDDKENSTLDSENQPVSDNNTLPFENETLVKLPPNTTLTTAASTQETSLTVSREVSTTPASGLQNSSLSPIQNQNDTGTPPIPITTDRPTSTTVRVQMPPTAGSSQNGSIPLIIESGTIAQGQISKTEGNEKEVKNSQPGNKDDSITVVSNSSNKSDEEGVTAGAVPPFSEFQNSSSEASSSSPENFGSPIQNRESENSSEASSSRPNLLQYSPTPIQNSKFVAQKTESTVPSTSNGASQTMSATPPPDPKNGGIPSKVEATQIRSDDINDRENNTSDSGIKDQIQDKTEIKGKENNSEPGNKVLNVSVVTHSSNNALDTSMKNSSTTVAHPLSVSLIPPKPTSQSNHTEIYSTPKSARGDLLTLTDQGKGPARGPESDDNKLAQNNGPSSQSTTLRTTTVIYKTPKPHPESEPKQSISVDVDQLNSVPTSGTLTDNEANPAEVDRDVDTEKQGGINRVKNSNDLPAQDRDNVTHPVGGKEKKRQSLDTLTDLFDALSKNRLGKFEIAYVILGLYVFVVAVVFLVFLCKNPREPRSRQLEELSKSREASRCFTYTMVCLLSLFLCLYVGIEVAVGEVLQTFASMETLRLSTASGYFLSYLFWGSFAVSRFVSIIISMKFSGFCILLTNLTICLVASIMLVAGADKIEALLWLGTVILGLGVGPLFPTAIAWVERYIHVTNKTASAFILGAALGEIVIPIIINAFINQEPMVLMYVNIIVNALCFVSFIILSILAFRHGEKYLKKPKRSLYRLTNVDDAEDGTELITNSFSNSNGTTDTGVKQRYRKLCT